MWKFKLTWSKFSIYNLSSNRSTELSPLLLQQFVERDNVEATRRPSRYQLIPDSGHFVGGFLAFTMISCQIKQSYNVIFLLYRWQLDVFQFTSHPRGFFSLNLQEGSRRLLNSVMECPRRAVKDTCGSLIQPAFVWVAGARWAQVWMVVWGGNSVQLCRWALSNVVGHLLGLL